MPPIIRYIRKEYLKYNMPDKKETEQLFRENYEQLTALALSLLHDENEARDAVSDVFERLVDGTLHLPLQRTDTYLMVAVRNHCLDRIRHLSLREKIRRHLTLSTPSLTPVDTGQQQIEDMMDYALQKLTPQTFRVFQLRFGDGMAYREIAQELSISEVAVYKHLAQALRKLREHFNPTIK